jgi:hypothetical protein
MSVVSNFDCNCYLLVISSVSGWYSSSNIWLFYLKNTHGERAAKTFVSLYKYLRKVVPLKHEKQQNYMKIADSVWLSLYKRDNEKVQHPYITHSIVKVHFEVCFHSYKSSCQCLFCHARFWQIQPIFLRGLEKM